MVMVHAGAPAGAVMVVGSLALADEAAPPPETEAVLVTLTGALAATFTVRVSGGKLVPAAREPVRTQSSKSPTITSSHSQPVPWTETAVSPAGRKRVGCVNS